jgi:aminopeptidase N
MNSVTRLTTLYLPHHYDLSVRLDRKGRTFHGTVTINGTALVNGEVRLHAKDLTIQSVLVDGKQATYEQQENDELAIQHTDITPGEHVLVVKFSGSITDTMNGIYPCYFEVDGEKKELLATQFESHYARQAFPCVDEPEAKATFDVTLTTENDITVLGNMPVASQQVENGQLVTTFETTPKMSSYLVAWVAGELQKKSAKTKDGTEVAIWATAAQPAESLDFALEIAVNSIEFFNEYFGVPYPLPKSDHVALPDFSAGAMENWGLITYREIALLVDPKVTTLSAKQYAATVIAHELSHQWFGNLVTMKWWNDLWLNESFANMMEYVAIDALHPEWQVWLDHASSEVVSALRRDSLNGVQSIQTEVLHPDEISSVFDPSIVYAKGGRLLRMLQAYVGTDAFRQGLKSYFEKHQYTNTEATDLWACLSEASGKDIATFMHAWMTQSGYPVVSVQRDGDHVTINQRQFFIGEGNDAQQRWPIPLHGTSSQIPELLDTESAQFSYTDKVPLQLNQGGTAHFITHYDKASLQALLEYLPSLPTIDRLQLLHEQTLLAQAGIISSADLLPLLEYYKDETEETVWGIISLAINELKRFVETDEQAEAKLRRLVGTLALPQYERLGWEPAPGETENDTKLRSLIISLSLYGEIPDALETAKQTYKTTPLSELDPELRTAILANAVRQKVDDDIIDTLLAAYKKTQHSEVRDDIAAAITATKELAVIQRLVPLVKDASIVRSQDFLHWYIWLLRNRYGRSYMWQWTQDDWEWLKDTFSGDSHYDMLPRYIAGSLITQEHLEQFVSFFTPYQSDIALKRNILIGETELKAKVALLERDGALVRQRLIEA